ncbi:ead/Ea22-like family protein [Salmonella enterica subsp. enterica serovar Newport]|nr:ead/Ea22-like family protein [Salmonella enterica subsp. enterica serovar Newport]ECB1216506.1 ead/Ea22-like family protein [Salmonella enterica subsp. enterica serovar Newport]ECB3647578.1 ead/Ea22-like family protein [Salmonella enterica subsp. enterica serovar Newport]
MNIDKRALREVAEKATKGPWTLFSDIDTKTFSIHTPRDKRCENVIKWGGFDCQPNAEANAEFIAAFNPKVALALLDENIQLQREKDAIEAVAMALRDDMRQAREQLEEAEKQIVELSRAASVNSQWKPDVCPVTGRKFFMWIEHETLDYVPTYGGPFDSYTIPTRDSSGEFSCERYDHDLGGWVGGEFIGLYLIDDDEQCRVCELEERIAELERSETQLINERDAAESALADMYQAATGERPEWSNMFGFADAVDVVEERLATLEANQSQTTPTGIQLITEAIGAHGYIVGCLLQGRPDLALEESRKWVSAFGQAAEIVSAQDADDIKVKGE